MADEKVDSPSIDSNALKHLERMGLSPDQAQDAFLDLVEGAKVSVQFNTGKSIDDQEAKKRVERAISNPQQADPMLRASLVLKQAQATNPQLSLQMQNDLNTASEKFTATYGSPKDVATAAALSIAGKTASSESGQLISDTSRAIGRIKNISSSSIPQTREGLIYAFQAAKLATAGAGISPTLSASLGTSRSRPSIAQKETDLKLRGLSPSVIQQTERAPSLKEAAIILEKNGVSKEEAGKVANIIRYKTLSRTVSQIGQTNPSLLGDVSVNEQKDIISASLSAEANPGNEVLGVFSASLSNGESWQEFAQGQSLDQDFIANLPSPLTRLSSVEQAENLLELDEAVNQGLRDNPEALESVVLSGHESSSWQRLQEAKAFFRSGETNSRMLTNMDRILPNMPSESPFFSYLSSAREAVDLVDGSFWKKTFSVSNRVFGGFGEKGVSFLSRTPIGGIFQSMGKKTGSWLAGKAVNLGGKGVMAIGKKAATSGALKGVTAAIGGVLGVGTGPAGWVALAGSLGFDLLKNGFKKLGSGINNFLTGAFSGSGEDDSDSKIIFIIPIAVIGTIITLAILAVAAIGSSLYVASERMTDQEYFDNMERARVPNDELLRAIPGLDDGSAARRALELEQIFKECFGTETPLVTLDNFNTYKSCLEGRIDAATLAQIASSVEMGEDDCDYVDEDGKSTNCQLQCVGFKKAIEPGIRGESGNAKSFARDNIPGFSLSNDFDNIQIGDNVVNSSGKYGHIAIISNIVPDPLGVGKDIYWVTEADGYSGAVGTRKIPLEELKSYFDYFLRN